MRLCTGVASCVDHKVLRVALRRQKKNKPIQKGAKVAAAQAAVTTAKAIAVADLKDTNRLAAEFEALGGGALTMALAQEADPGGTLSRVLARTRAAPRVRGPLDLV
jgi:hypothetical protein